MQRQATTAVRLGTGLLILSLFAACRGDGAGDAGLTGPTGSPPSQQPAPRSITLAWDSPSENEDGSPLTDLAGHRLYYGTTSPLTVGNSTSVDVGTETTHSITNLTPGTYFVAVSAYDALANEGPRSAEIAVQVLP